MNERLPSSGRLLQLIALGHVAVGSAVYRKELARMSREGVVGTVSFHGPNAEAFWFMAPAVPLFMAGELVEGAERAGDAKALRRTSQLGVAGALISVICMPVSGFWAWLGISIRGLVVARRMSG